MPEDPLAQPRKTDASTAGPAQSSVPAKAAVPVSNNARPGVAPAEETEDSAPLPAKSSPAIIILGALSAILLIVALLFGAKISARDRTIQEMKNRSDQVQTASTQLQTQVDDAKVDAAALQKKLDAAEADSAQLKDELEKAKAGVVEVQGRLDKARAAATAFQTQAEDNKVASLKHEGEVEVAHAQTAVMLEQMNKAKSDLADLKTQLSETQDKLDKAEQEIARLQKSPAKK
jgi:septal ring factor EnvC (AmiA/AmiB activator)